MPREPLQSIPKKNQILKAPKTENKKRSSRISAKDSKTQQELQSNSKKSLNSRKKKYKVNTGFITQQLKDKTLIFSAEKSIMYTLNDTAAFIFNCIKKGWSEEKIIQKIISQYDIEEKTAKGDFNDCVSDLTRKNIVSSSRNL